MTVEDNLNILKIESVNTSTMNEILRKLGLEDKRRAKVRNLSGGQKQRVAIARALIKNPNILLADEPTGNLNFAIGENVIRELIEACEGKTLIVVSHDERLAQYFDQVLVVDDMTITSNIK